jgi:hypothetical protein
MSNIIVADEVTGSEKSLILKLQEEHKNNLCQFCKERNIQQNKSIQIPIYKIDGQVGLLPAYKTCKIEIEQCFVCSDENFNKASENDFLYLIRFIVLLSIFPFRVLFNLIVGLFSFAISLPFDLVIGLFTGKIEEKLKNSFTGLKLMININISDFFSKNFDYLIYSKHSLLKALVNKNWKIGKIK